MSSRTDQSDNSDYYAARAVEERRQAMAAKDSNVREIHLKMAEKYEELAASGGAEPQQLIAEQQKAG